MVKEIEYFRMPLNSVHITQNYKRSHKAIDITSPREGKEADVLSVFDGTVNRILKSPKTGNILEIKHDYNGYTWFSQFKHLAKIYVKKGDKVKMGQAVARIGDTGSLATGVHLHYALFRMKKGSSKPVNGKEVNPRSYTYLYDNQEAEPKSVKYFSRAYGLPVDRNKYVNQLEVKGDMNCRSTPSGKVLGPTVNGVYNWDSKTKKGVYNWYHIGNGEYVADVKNKVIVMKGDNDEH